MTSDLRRWMNAVVPLSTLTEAEGGDLYHGTSVVNAASIVADNKLVGDTTYGDTAEGISFTRSERLAWEFAGIAEQRAYSFDYDKPPPDRPSMRGAVLVFDGMRLRALLGDKLRDYVWNPADQIDDEEEERFHGGELNFGASLKAIKVAPEDVAWWARVVPQLSNTYDASFAPTIAALLRHPKAIR